ncbi:MAG TPA: GNAT family N-acetyltransferase [Nocardioides sp.]|uniref:GNAT family N-acetyltransferase n=1 Tax=uncultured Nocardioides sp. TaxID=198441 RepID=UPI00260D4CA7|nr:GNAT family N-acetyltransferase [uncultured Nocardioides sp.]HRD60840.1 GNAT family N-acetyltransferase [Nocardioides sp.]HRI94696.1 GNAT family N-acetyltransferase [Nocardioides sp.]HRK44505.1 GNAT family N-acetyltransferase [Nocardioides sp.]
MDEQTGERAETHRIRPARAADLPHLGPIEDAGGPQFAAHFGDAIEPILLSPAPTGQSRAAHDGFLLVVTLDGQEPPVGFVHVLVIDEHAHLEQISVLPDHQRRGLGRALIEAAMAEARAQGFTGLSLCTYRDVPWNGPYYAALGFEEIAEADLAPYQRRLREREAELGLDVNGARCVMSIALR